MKKITQTVRLSMLAAIMMSSALGKTNAEPEEVVENTARKVMAVLRDNSLDTSSKQDKIMAIISPVFDFKIMAKQTLDQAWPQFETDQQEEFVSLFKKTLLNTYYKSAELVSDEKVNIAGARKTESAAIIQTQITGSGEKLQIDYWLCKNQDAWKVCNVVIDGINIVRARAEDYKEQLQSLSPTEFLDKMRKITEE